MYVICETSWTESLPVQWGGLKQEYLSWSVGMGMGWKKLFPHLEQVEEKTSLLRQETLLTQQADFLLIRESQP